jgi:hypothetical protein
MKKNIMITIASLLLWVLSSHAQNSIFPKGKKVQANFTGKVWVQPLIRYQIMRSV